MMQPHEMPHPDDPERILPEFQRAWEPAPPRERKPVPTKRPATFRDPLGPHIGIRKRRRAIVRAALESIVTGDKSSPADRAAARKLLGDLGRIERERPDTTMINMVRAGAGLMTIWVYEPELAPEGNTPEQTFTRNAAINRAWHALRSM